MLQFPQNPVSLFYLLSNVFFICWTVIKKKFGFCCCEWSPLRCSDLIHPLFMCTSVQHIIFYNLVTMCIDPQPIKHFLFFCRTLLDQTVTELKHQVSLLRQREGRVLEQNRDLQHTMLDLESKLETISDRTPSSLDMVSLRESEIIAVFGRSGLCMHTCWVQQT